MVSTFSRANNSALRQGFSDDMRTYLVVAGEKKTFNWQIPVLLLQFQAQLTYFTGNWSATWYFGNFLGGSVGGLLVDALGFQSTTIM